MKMYECASFLRCERVHLTAGEDGRVKRYNMSEFLRARGRERATFLKRVEKNSQDFVVHGHGR